MKTNLRGGFMPLLFFRVDILVFYEGIGLRLRKE